MENAAQYDDATLVAQMKAGDQPSFTEIYKRYWDKLFYIAYNRLSSEDEAENVVQDVFLTLWRKREQLNIQSLGFYLSTMTQHAVFEQLAKRKRRSVIEQKARAGLHEQKDFAGDLDNKHLLETVNKYAKDLPKKCRMVFIHNKLLDMPLSEVAKMMNISEKTAETHLTKALKTIRQQVRRIPLLEGLLLVNSVAAKGYLLFKLSYIGL